MAFDPTSGSTLSIPTPGTTLLALSPAVTNGNIYAGGFGTFNSTSYQVYSLRVDNAVQSLRDFIVDSQLMQDFDDPSQPTHNPNGVARYQTHLTLIDDQKAPLANHAVKLWSDQANTNVIVNGKNFTIGPEDDQYAAVTTDTSGALTIMSGYTLADGSDKPDMSAPPLRAWASFMDPYERMLLFRDREFHNRVASAHATDAGQSGADDPTRPNLQTAQTYGPIQRGGGNSGDPLFTDKEKQDNQPQQVAATIQKMSATVGSSPPPGSKTMKASFALHATDAPGKYAAYADTPGAQYSPVNVAANRAAVVIQPGGLSYSRGTIPQGVDPTTVPPAYASMTPAQATQAIDALEGQPWHTSQYATPRVKDAVAAGTVHLGGFFDDFWNWIKGAAATITHIIVSAADDIYAGIRFIVDGVEHVFQAIVTGIEQIASIIAAFLIELGHLIEEIIEALSILFQFGHIIDTHNILKAELLNRINGVPGNAAYPGLANLVTNTAMPAVDSFFQTGEQAISDALDDLANALSGVPADGLAGGGSTVHSAFTAAPKGGGAPSSTANQSTWALQKFKSGIGGSNLNSSMLSIQGQADPITAFFTTFASKLTSDPQLSSQWQQVKSGAQGLGSAASPGDFLEHGLAELFRILALIMDGVLAVSNAMIDGLLAEISALIQTMFDPQSGILTQPLDIPVLSWLYHLLFGEPLTILNAAMLVVAIPVTILWRIIDGRWPSDSMDASTMRSTLGASLVATKPIQILLGVTNALFTGVLGFLYAIGDALNWATPQIVSRIALALSVLGAVCTAPAWTSSSPGSGDWAAWAMGLGTGLLNILGAVDFPEGAIDDTFGPTMLAALSFMQAIVLGVQFKTSPPSSTVGDAALGISIATLLPGTINPAKLESAVGQALVVSLDVIMGLAGCVAGFLETFDPSSS
jgi:hypothetical protein